PPLLPQKLYHLMECHEGNCPDTPRDERHAEPETAQAAVAVRKSRWCAARSASRTVYVFLRRSSTKYGMNVLLSIAERNPDAPTSPNRSEVAKYQPERLGSVSMLKPILKSGVLH